VLDPAKLPTLAAAAGVPVTTLAEAASSSALVEYVQRQIDVANRSLARVQTVKRIALLTEEFSIEGGELTPSLKLKRRVVNQKYATIIERLYATEAS
jgi:long-subunit acyl-CoA synthetase (AMP-forming)